MITISDSYYYELRGVYIADILSGITHSKRVRIPWRWSERKEEGERRVKRRGAVCRVRLNDVLFVLLFLFFIFYDIGLELP